MRAAPFLLIFAILIGGIVIAYQNLSSVPDQAQAAARPTVTPRPRATSSTNLAESVPVPQFKLPAVAGATAQPAPPTDQPAPTAEPTGPQPTAAQPSATPQPAPTRTAVAVRPASSPTAVPAATPGPTAQSQATLRVGNTDGQGVFLRRTPRMDDKIRVWRDNTPMVVIGPAVDADGHSWQHVRAPDGTEGYIPSEWLVQ